MENVHERHIDAPMETVVQLLATLASVDDRVWPGDRWPPLRLDRGLVVGSAGGHGYVRYRVDTVERDRVAFRFDPKLHMDGTHTFAIAPDGDGTRIRHTIVATPARAMRVVWPLIIEPLHDALTEDAFDSIESAATGVALRRSALPLGVRMRLRLLNAVRRRPGPRAVA